MSLEICLDNKIVRKTAALATGVLALVSAGCFSEGIVDYNERVIEELNKLPVEKFIPRNDLYIGATTPRKFVRLDNENPVFPALGPDVPVFEIASRSAFLIKNDGSVEIVYPSGGNRGRLILAEVKSNDAAKMLKTADPCNKLGFFWPEHAVPQIYCTDPK